MVVMRVPFVRMRVLSEQRLPHNLKCIYDSTTITSMQLDLNLLRALDALLEEGSVGGAADRLHLSQPAMSRTLARIRRATGDDIMVRSGHAMVPTPYALAVRDRVHELVEQAESVLSPVRDISPGDLDAVFTLRCHDTVTDVLAPILIARLRAEAPGVRLRFVGEPSADDDGLRSGAADIEIGSSAQAAPDIASQTIRHERLIVVMRSGHRLAEQRLTADDYLAAEHITISRRGRLEDRMDALLRAQGMARHVVASSPTRTTALRIVQDTDTLVTVPESLSSADISTFHLATAAAPFELPEVPIIMNWHARNNGDPAHRWLRGLVVGLLLDRTEPSA
jgi:DNA-binding transcriptional LysR family regulator